MPDQNTRRFLTLAQVMERIPYSESQIWRKEQDGSFPKRVKLGPNRVAWLVSEIDAWIDVRLQERKQ